VQDIANPNERIMQDTVPQTSATAPSLYETDFYAWANEQAALLRTGRLNEADIANIAEEIESMGRSEKRELVNRLVVLLMHLLKWRFQPSKRGKSWRLTIKGQRTELRRHMRDNPSLKAKLTEALTDAYESARIDAARETGLAEDSFPASCPWTYTEIIDDSFWPEK
jgi:Domain of unknown function DUF29